MATTSTCDGRTRSSSSSFRHTSSVSYGWTFALYLLVIICVHGPRMMIPGFKLTHPIPPPNTHHSPSHTHHWQTPAKRSIRQSFSLLKSSPIPRVIHSIEELRSCINNYHSNNSSSNSSGNATSGSVLDSKTDLASHNGSSGRSSFLLSILPSFLPSFNTFQRLRTFTISILPFSRFITGNWKGWSKRRNPLQDIVVIGNTTCLDPSQHPTVQLLLQRLQEQSKPGKRSINDTEKIALCIEGGGMRGCVSAGAVAALNLLGLNDAVDVVYGSSAGAMIGAYFVSRQYSGLSIYYDLIPAVGREFIDLLKLLPAGIPVTVMWSSTKKRVVAILDKSRKLLPFIATKGVTNNSSVNGSTYSHSHPHSKTHTHPSNAVTSVLNLNFLLDVVMKVLYPFDWSTFSHNERLQPLRIITSNAKTLQSVVLSRDHGHFHDLDSLSHCIRASMLVPGVTQPLLAIESSSNSSFITMSVSSPSLSVPLPFTLNLNMSLPSLLSVFINITKNRKILRGSKQEQTQGHEQEDQKQGKEQLEQQQKLRPSQRLLNSNESVARAISSSLFPLMFSSLPPSSSNQSLSNSSMSLHARDAIGTVGRTMLSGVLFPPLVALTMGKVTVNVGRMVLENAKQRGRQVVDRLADDGDDEISDKIDRPALAFVPRRLRRIVAGAKRKVGDISRRTDFYHSVPGNEKHHYQDHQDHPIGGKWFAIRRRIVKKQHQQEELSAVIDRYANTTESHLCDALLCEPIPYRSAIQEAKHLIVLRTKPDPCRILGKSPGIYEELIANSFFHKHGAKNATGWMKGLEHLRIYAEDILLCNEGAKGKEVDVFGTPAYILPIAPTNAAEVGQLEKRREFILLGMRSGARRVLELFLPQLASSSSLPDDKKFLQNATVDDMINQLFPLPKRLSKKEKKLMKIKNATPMVTQGRMIE